jgi:hypothetical protein
MQRQQTRRAACRQHRQVCARQPLRQRRRVILPALTYTRYEERLLPSSSMKPATPRVPGAPAIAVTRKRVFCLRRSSVFHTCIGYSCATPAARRAAHLVLTPRSPARCCPQRAPVRRSARRSPAAPAARRPPASRHRFLL